MVIQSSSIEEIICKYISNKNSIFVFNTSIAYDTWSEWTVRNSNKTKINAVAMNRFIAWDTFKGKYVRAKEENKTAIPSIVRKFFSTDLLARNCKEQFFKKIIRRKPAKISNAEYLTESLSFTDWISSILPSLQLWIDLRGDNKTFDDEDKDYLFLYNEYKTFLEKNNFFEQSWIEPEFSADKIFIIFYPELIQDYEEYKHIFEKKDNIIEVRLPEIKTKPDVIEYENSRTELRQTMLKIRKLIKDTPDLSTQIALNVPNLDNLQPYIKRELELYCIPYKMRIGVPLTKNCAGKIFQSLQNCVASSFSYESVRALLSDENIPWKNKTFNEILIKQGCECRCICGYEDETSNGKLIDVWEKSLQPILIDENNFLDLPSLYKKLKTSIKKICDAKTFKQIEEAWFAFKTEHLDFEHIDLTTTTKEQVELQDNILSRCITHLKEMIEIKESDNTSESIKNLKIENPYSFFLNELTSKTYTPQSSKIGISVFDYKTSAMANFKYQFVVGCSQKSIEIPYQNLSFLNNTKRTELFSSQKKSSQKFFTMDRSVSEKFIALYNKSNCVFSYAENSFDGFTIPHNALSIKEADDIEQLNETDFILAEKNLLLDLSTSSEKDFLKHYPNKKFSNKQRKHFELWSKNNDRIIAEYFKLFVGDEVIKLLDKKLIESKNESLKNSIEKKYKKFGSDSKTREAEIKNTISDRIKITQTDLSRFFPCTRSWLFSQVLYLNEESLDTDLFDAFDMGNIYHKILELYMKHLSQNNLPLPTTNDANLFNDENAQRKILENSFAIALKDYEQKNLMHTAILAQKDSIINSVMDFLHLLCNEDIPPQKINSKSNTKGFGGYKVYNAENVGCIQDENGLFDYYGKPDLILTNSEGQNAIIDYKTKNLPKTNAFEVSEDGTISNFQMQVYLKIFKKELHDFSNASFYSIAGLESNSVIDKYKGFSETQLQTKYIQSDSIPPVHDEKYFSTSIEAMTKYAKIFYEYIQDVKNNKKNFTPSSTSAQEIFKVTSYENCSSCAYKSICRYNYTVAGKEILNSEN